MNTIVAQAPFPGLVEIDSEGKPYMRIAPLAERRLITTWDEITPESFKELFQVKAGELWSQVEILYKEYGPVLSVPVGSALMYAQEDGKLPWCIELLEKHLKDDLQYQHPDLRGRLIIGDNPINRSEMFLVHEIIQPLRPQLFKQ